MDTGVIEMFSQRLSEISVIYQQCPDWYWKELRASGPRIYRTYNRLFIRVFYII